MHAPHFYVYLYTLVEKPNSRAFLFIFYLFILLAPAVAASPLYTAVECVRTPFTNKRRLRRQ